MKFICPFIFAVLLAAPLWAKTSYYILPVHLKNVHEDYAEKIVSLTKEYVAVEGDEVVPNKSDCDYLLQIKLIRKEKGVAVIYEKRSPEGELLWSYGHIAYSPEDFAPVISSSFCVKFRIIYPWAQNPKACMAPCWALLFLWRICSGVVLWSRIWVPVSMVDSSQRRSKQSLKIGMV